MTEEKERIMNEVDRLMHLSVVLNYELEETGDFPITERILKDTIFRVRAKIIELTNKLMSP